MVLWQQQTAEGRTPAGRDPQDGFTLIELLIVVIIMAILASIAMAVYLGATQKAVAADCLYIRTYAEHADKEYYAEHSSTFSPNFAALVSERLIDETPVCPAGGQLVWVEGKFKGTDKPTRILVCSLHSKASDAVLYATTFDNMEGLRILLGSWTLANGKLSPTGAAGEHRVSLGSGTWTDFQIDVTATLLSGPGYGVYYRSDGQTNISGYVFQFDPGLGNRFVVRKVVNGQEQTQFQSVAMPAGFNLNAQHQISIKVVGTQQYMIVDGVVVLQFQDSTFTSGTAGLRTWSNSQVVFEDVTVRPVTTPK
jgi:prepilin-type N-terminal cleavage/methylation domain-containing protein